MFRHRSSIRSPAGPRRRPSPSMPIIAWSPRPAARRSPKAPPLPRRAMTGRAKRFANTRAARRRGNPRRQDARRPDPDAFGDRSAKIGSDAWSPSENQDADRLLSRLPSHVFAYLVFGTDIGLISERTRKIVAQHRVRSSRSVPTRPYRWRPAGDGPAPPRRRSQYGRAVRRSSCDLDRGRT